MSIMQLMGTVFTVLKMGLEYFQDKQKERFLLAVQQINQIEKMSDEEVNEAMSIRVVANDDPSAGRL